MKIVVGTDFSEQAQRATLLAAKLAQRFGDDLVLVHAFEPWIITDADVVPPTWMEQAKTDAKARLARAADKVREAGARVETRLLDGLADTVLGDVGAEVSARFIVVGTHGRRGVQRLLVGSVATRVTQAAERPVLVLREDNPGLRSWLEGSRRLKVMLAVGDTLGADGIIAWARGLRETVAVDLTFVHLYWPPEEHQRLGTEAPSDFVTPDLEVLRVLRRDLAAKVGQLPGDGTVSFIVRPQWGRVGDALSLTASELGVDFIVTGTHHRRFAQRVLRGAVSRQVLASANVPVVCVPVSPTSHARAPVDVRRVLAATDLSDAGNAAVHYAYGVLRGKGGTVDITYVKGKGENANDHALEMRLRDLIPADASDGGVITRIRLLESDDPAQCITQTAARLGSDLVCVGSRGRTGIGRALLGSVAINVVDSSPRPVLIVRTLE